MTLTGVLVLAAGVEIIPVADLDERVRQRLGALQDTPADAHALTRPQGRGTSTLVDQSLVDLLREFASPTTVVDAVLRFCTTRRLEPKRVLDESYSPLRRCVDQGYLVEAGSGSARRVTQMYASGDPLAGGAVESLIHILDDVELYRVGRPDGSPVAVKVLRSGAQDVISAAFTREAEVLRMLGGGVAPRLDAVGTDDDRAWIAMEWCAGVNLVEAAAARRSTIAGDRSVLDLARAVVSAYAELHARGITHGDVHPGNVLVTDAGEVRILDFGLAELANPHATRMARGGAPPYLAPDHAAALLGGGVPGPATPASDQYSLGAVLYEVFTGEPYVEFSIDHREALRQIVDAPPLSFSRRGRAGWPAVERALRRSLAKEPGRRYARLEDLARELAAVVPPLPIVTTPAYGPQALLDEVVEAAGPGGDWYERGLPTAPLSSVAYGSAGLACVLHHVALLRENPELLRLADEWALRATARRGDPEAFGGPEPTTEPDIVGPVTPFHRVSGAHAVQVLVSHALSDIGARRLALQQYLAAVSVPDARFDLTLGRGGVLLGCCLLLEAMAGDPLGDPALDVAPIVVLGDGLMDELWRWLDSLPPMVEAAELPQLGVAHGWAGLMLVTLRWCAAADRRVPAQVGERADQLASLAVPTSHGLRWPWLVGGESWMRGWCNGSAGLVHLWTAAHDRWHDERWLSLAEGAARHASVADHQIPQLCCGLAGQAYAQLELYRHTGDVTWLSEARKLAQTASDRLDSPGQFNVTGSLHKGDIGVSALAADLERPEEASMPFFGPSL